MKFDKNLLNATFEDIKNNYTLYRRVIDIITFVEHKSPKGACCGRQDGIINKFIEKRNFYVSEIEKITNRTIRPLWNGSLFFSTAHKLINADYLSDDDILKLIASGQVSKDKFDFSNFNDKTEQQVEVEQPVETVTKKSNKKHKKSKK